MNQASRRYLVKRIDEIARAKVESLSKTDRESLTIAKLLSSGDLKLPDKAKLKAFVATIGDQQVGSLRKTIYVKLGDLFYGDVETASSKYTAAIEAKYASDNKRAATIRARATQLKDTIMLGKSEEALAQLAAFEKEEI